MSIGFPALGIVLAFCIFLAIRYRMAGRKYQEESDRFWRREQEANLSVRRDVDFDKLPYLTVPLSRFPSDPEILEDEEYTKLIGQLQELSKKRMMNLSDKTNTDLKLDYGRNHLDEMQKVGENYDTLTVLLVSIAKRLMELQRYEDAITVLEYGVSTGTDVSSNYTLLGDCYMNAGRSHKIRELMETVEGTNMIMKTSILTHLKQLLPEEGEVENFSAESASR